ncbi:MAG: rod shape-determining protein MreD [Tannerella sp.]|jgi:rod shape-determining protein MreD|nr:rod shape-determining protein MreD [Tannerella sp.]
MIKTVLKTILRLAVFVLLQVWILNRLHLFGIVEPFLYIYVILKLPISISRSHGILISFLSGFVIDVFSNTPGMHAAACTLIGFLRYPLMGVYVEKELAAHVTPSYHTFGVAAFMRYAATLTAIHHVALFLIESVSLFDPAFLFLRIFASVMLTTVCIFVLEAFHVKRRSND